MQNFPENSPLHILVMRLSAMGDVILLLPLLERLCKSLPHAQVTFVVSESFYPLCYHLADDIEIIPIKKPKTINDYFKLYQQFKNRTFDILLACQASFRINLIYTLISAKRKIGFDGKRAKDLHGLFTDEYIPFLAEHLADSFQQFATYLKLPPQLIEWHFPENKSLQNEITHKLDTNKQWIALNPAASKKERSHSEVFWIELCALILKRTPYNIVLTGASGAFELKRASNIAQALNQPDRVQNWVGQTSLEVLIELMRFVQCLIAPDTGTLHLCNAVKTPVIGLYAIASPELSGPYNYQQWVENVYPAAVRLFLHKDPSKVRWGTRVHHEKAMELIKVEPVFEKLLLCLSYYSKKH